jgi:SpoVK/Ycf46/Vps4 family AAA+-type ATPase
MEVGQKLWGVGREQKNLFLPGELDPIFDAAKNSHHVLFFDEADALFGKRTDVKDRRDRYANIEVNYLVRTGKYGELTILTANNHIKIDKALMRKFHSIIRVPQQRKAAS